MGRKQPTPIPDTATRPKPPPAPPRARPLLRHYMSFTNAMESLCGSWERNRVVMEEHVTCNACAAILEALEEKGRIKR